MAQLQRMLHQFISSEQKINNAASDEKKLQEKHQSLLDGNVSFSVEEAESIYNAYQSIIKHRQQVEDAKTKLSQASEVIKQYLEATGGKQISYMHEEGIQYLTYAFQLNKKGEVVHSRQNKNQ